MKSLPGTDPDFRLSQRLAIPLGRLDRLAAITIV
jgi:hypothetical protein